MKAQRNSLLVIPVAWGLRSASLVLAGLSFSALTIHAQNTITNVISTVVSYQYYDGFSSLGTNSFITSPVASEQYFDWPGAVTVGQLNSSSAGYYYVPAAPYLQLAQADQGAFQITVFEGAMLSLYSVEFSTDLVNWQAMTNATITPPNIGVQIYATAGTNNAGFYRVVAQ